MVIFLKNARSLFITIWLLIYLVIFWLVNERSAGDPDMLLCSGLDEYALYPYVLRMLAMINQKQYLSFLDHQQYSYGYLHYFVAILTILPSYLMNGFEQVTSRSDIHLLRMLSPFFYFFGCLLLVCSWSREKGSIYFWSLFAFMLFVPAAFLNNTWWHPDALQFLVVSSTLFLIGKDNYRAGNYFYASAITIALSISVKTLGILFLPLIPVYLMISKGRGYLTSRQLALRLVQFVGLLLVAYLISYPSVLIPGVIDGIIKFASEEKVRQQLDRTNESFIYRPLSYYKEVVSVYYGWMGFIIVIGLGILRAAYRGGAKNSLFFITIAWSMLHILFVIFFLKKAAYYLIPSLIMVFPFAWDFAYYAIRSVGNQMRALSFAIIFVIAYQAIINVGLDYRIYTDLMHEEERCPALHSYRKLSDSGLFSNQSGKPIKILKDIDIYMPRDISYMALYSWGGLSYDLKKSFDPDLILIRKGNKTPGQGAEEKLNSGLDIYLDAANNRINDYNIAYEDSFMTAFKRVTPPLSPEAR